jgi:pimeloyl-ACP methyl ester carboxylesterase
METIAANDTSIAFKRSGNGPPLLLLHGAEADHSMFDAFGALLAPHFTVIAYDQRDSGETRNPPSLGGAIAQLLAARHPARIDRLVLSSTFRPGAALSTINPEEFPKIVALRSRLPESTAELAQYFYTPDYLTAHPELANRFAGSKRNEEQKQRRAGILTRPVEFELSAISAPTLVLAGSEDRLIPKAHTLSLAREIAGAKTAIIAGVGHVGTIQDPAAVAAEALAFLQHYQA